MNQAKDKQRTNQQNKALHLLFKQLADELNDAGYEQKITIGTVETPWNEWSVKSLFKKIAKAQFGKIHTSDLTTKEVQAVYETMNRALAEHGVHVPWPSIEELMWQERIGK